MGVKGLLPVLAKVTFKKHLREYTGKRIAVDGSVWLHRCAARCSVELYRDPSGVDLLPHLVQLTDVLRRNGIIPVIVFDGDLNPSKSETDTERSRLRCDAIDQLMSLRCRKAVEEPFTDEEERLTIQAISITPVVYQSWIQWLDGEGIEHIRAPYEADPQLAHLARIGYVDCVLTEDSDLIVFQTPITLFKLSNSGFVDEIRYTDVLQLIGLDEVRFTTACILAGCDFLKNIRGIGIKTAIRLVTTYGDIEGVLECLRQSKKYAVPREYRRGFDIALSTYYHQVVYDPGMRENIPLSPLEQTPVRFVPLKEPFISPMFD